MVCVHSGPGVCKLGVGLWYGFSSGRRVAGGSSDLCESWGALPESSKGMRELEKVRYGWSV